MPRAIISRLTGTVIIKAIASDSSRLHQNNPSPKLALIAPGTNNINILSTASMVLIDTVSVANAVFIALFLSLSFR